MHTTTTRAQAAPALRSAAPAALQRLRQFLRTPKGSLLAIFLGLFGLGATAVGWPLAVPHMLAAVLGASVTDVAIYLLVGLLAGNGAIESLQPFVGMLIAQGNVGIGNPLLSVADPALFPFWISQGEWARANLPVIKRWITALNEAKAFMEQNPSEARAILAKYTKLPPAVAQKIPFPNFEFSIQPEQLDVWVRTLRDLGQLSVAVDSNKLVVTPK